MVNGHKKNACPNVDRCDKLYFKADDGTHGGELWVTDGTTSGTVLLKDINPGSATSYISYSMVVCNGKLYFSAETATSGDELWVTDGTTSGTVMVKDIWPGASGSHPDHLVAYTMGISNTKLFFVAHDGVHGYELWSSNGTAAGTTMLLDIQPGYTSALMSYNNMPTLYPYLFKLYFHAYDSIHGHELWVTNGTAAGTVMIKDINSAVGAGSHPEAFTAYHGKVYFRADDGINGSQLWRTDGTGAGTEYITPAVVTTASPLSGSSFIEFYTYNQALYYNADYNTFGRELWKLDIPWYINTSTAPTAGGTATGGGGFHQGDAVNLVASPNANYTFVNWTENSVEVSTSPNYSFTCGQYDRTLVANFLLSVGVDDLENNNNQITISPNPATTELNIHYSGSNISEIYIYDISGRLVLNIDNKGNSSNEITIDIESLQKGMYFMKVSGANTNTAYKFVKL